jgi:hypothetical protein
MNQPADGTTRRRGTRGCPWGRESGYATGHSWWGSDPTGVTDPRPAPPGRSEPPDFRVSDQERDSVAQTLNQHFEAGRLDVAEFGERTERALNARTRGDLSGLLSDLPPLRSSDPERLPRRGPGPWIFLPVVVAVIVAVSFGTAVFGTGDGHFFPWFVIPIGIVAALRFRRREWSPRARAS